TNAEDRESRRPQVEGFIVRELTRVPSNFRSQETLEAYLIENRIVGLEGIDTRALVKRLRVRGSMNGAVSTTDLDETSLMKKAKALPNIVGRDLARAVMPEKSFAWREGFISRFASQELKPAGRRHRVVALDCGMKWNILRCLTQVGCDVTVVPGAAS